jgi:diadenylate cyclase
VLEIGQQLDRYAVELGEEGQLLRLQVADVVWDVDKVMEVVYRDYSGSRARAPKALRSLRQMGLADLEDVARVASVLDLGAMETAVHPRGLRALSGVPRLPETVTAALVAKYHGLLGILAADVSSFEQIDGIGRARARQLRRYFDRMLDLSPHLMDED